MNLTNFLLLIWGVLGSLGGTVLLIVRAIRIRRATAHEKAADQDDDAYTARIPSARLLGAGLGALSSGVLIAALELFRQGTGTG